MREPVTAYLGLGSNLGDREENLGRALALLAGKVSLEDVSSIYETEPVGYEAQPLFLNLVCRISTVRSPRELLLPASAHADWPSNHISAVWLLYSRNPCGAIPLLKPSSRHSRRQLQHAAGLRGRPHPADRDGSSPPHSLIKALNRR